MTLAVWAVKKINMLMMTRKRKMMIALAVRGMKILMTTSQTLETALKPTIKAQILLILQEQQESVINNMRTVLLLDLQDLLQ